MGALPKRKKSKSRAKNRLSHNAIKPPVLIECPQCHSLMMPHHACTVCGTYNGRQVVAVDIKKKASG
jgi:large subunit ribosomal protein L32